MPSKHAPASPRSFYLSVARAVAGAVAALALVIVVAVITVSSRDKSPAPLAGGGSPTATATATPTKKAATSPTPTASPSLRPKSEVTIQVLNGSGRSGLAGQVTARLDKAGYEMATPDNASSTTTTVVYYRSSAEADARAFLAAHDEFGAVKKAPSSLKGSSLLTIVLGTDYDRDS